MHHTLSDSSENSVSIYAAWCLMDKRAHVVLEHILLQSVHTGTFTQYVLNTDFGHGYFAM